MTTEPTHTTEKDRKPDVFTIGDVHYRPGSTGYALAAEIMRLNAQVKAAHDLLDEWERKHTHLGIERGHYGPSSMAWRVIFPSGKDDLMSDDHQAGA